MSSTLPIHCALPTAFEADPSALADEGLLVATEPSGAPAGGMTVGCDDGAMEFNAAAADKNGDPSVAGPVAWPPTVGRLPRGGVVYLPPGDDVTLGGLPVWAPNPLDRFMGQASAGGTAVPGSGAPTPGAFPGHVEVFCHGAAAALAQAGCQDLWRCWAQQPQPLLDRDGLKAAAGLRRRALGWSARRVGALLGVSGNTVFDHEKLGGRDWQADIAQRLGWLYCLRADWLTYTGFPVTGAIDTWREIAGRAAVLGWDACAFEANLGVSPRWLHANLEDGHELPAGVWGAVTEILQARLWPAPRGEFGHILTDNARFTGFAHFLLGAWHMSHAEMAAWLGAQGYAVGPDIVDNALNGKVQATSAIPNASRSIAEALGFTIPKPPKPPPAPPQFYDGRLTALLEERRNLRRWSLADLAERAAAKSHHLGRLLQFRGEALIDEFGPSAWRLIRLVAQALDVPLYDLDTLPRATFATACDRWLADAADTTLARRKTGCAAHDAVALVRVLRRALFLTPTGLAECVSAQEEFGVSSQVIQALEARLEVWDDDWVLDDRERIRLRKLLNILAVEVDPLTLLPRVVLAAGSDRAAIGEALRRAFAQSLYSKGELVARANIDKTVLARILRGESAASNPSLRRVAGRLNVVVP